MASQSAYKKSRATSDASVEEAYGNTVPEGCNTVNSDVRILTVKKI